MKRPIVVCDVDGVVANWWEAYLLQMVRLGNLTVDDAARWLVAEPMHSLEHTVGYCAEAAKSVRAAGLSPYPNQVSDLIGIARVVFCTHAHKDSTVWYYERIRWLDRHCPPPEGHESPPCCFVPSAEKPLMRGDFLIEDNPLTAILWAAENPLGMAFLIGPDFNKLEKYHEVIWDEAVKKAAIDVPENLVHLSRQNAWPEICWHVEKRARVSSPDDDCSP